MWTTGCAMEVTLQPNEKKSQSCGCSSNLELEAIRDVFSGAKQKQQHWTRSLFLEVLRRQGRHSEHAARKAGWEVLADGFITERVDYCPRSMGNTSSPSFMSADMASLRLGPTGEHLYALKQHQISETDIVSQRGGDSEKPLYRKRVQG
eukprot:6194960-Pleurochrysis_carterae.AAC.1